MKRSSRLMRLFNAQAGICSYCSKPMSVPYGLDNSATIDHIVPRSLGGTNDRDNLTCACFACNQKKRGDSLVIFLLKRAGGRVGPRF